MYKIRVHNDQGASEDFKGDTKAKIDAWLDTWQDPKKLTARVWDDEGTEMGTKPFGIKRITWIECRGRPSLSGETGERYQVTIPPSVEAKLRRYGGGSLSAGIIKIAKRIPSNQSGD
jgi:hypothetical protein